MSVQPTQTIVSKTTELSAVHVDAARMMKLLKAKFGAENFEVCLLQDVYYISAPELLSKVLIYLSLCILTCACKLTKTSRRMLTRSCAGGKLPNFQVNANDLCALVIGRLYLSQGRRVLNAPDWREVTRVRRGATEIFGLMRRDWTRYL